MFSEFSLLEYGGRIVLKLCYGKAIWANLNDPTLYPLMLPVTEYKTLLKRPGMPAIIVASISSLNSVATPEIRNGKAGWDYWDITPVLTKGRLPLNVFLLVDDVVTYFSFE